MEYAVIVTGGKQYTVHPGDTLKVEKLPVAEDELLELDRVLLVAKDGNVKVGHPLVEGALVKAQVVGQGKGSKDIGVQIQEQDQVQAQAGPSAAVHRAKGHGDR